MDSHGTVISLLNHRTFSERQLACVGRVAFARLSHNRLYLRIDVSGNVSDDWIRNCLICSAFDRGVIYAKASAIESVIWREDDHVIVRTAPLIDVHPFEGDLPESATVVIETRHDAKAYTALNRVARP